MRRHPLPTWPAVKMALPRGYRGLPGDTTLAQLLGEFRTKEPGLAKPQLHVEYSLTWARSHRQRTGRWLGVVSKKVLNAPSEMWGINSSTLKAELLGTPTSSGSACTPLTAVGENRSIATAIADPPSVSCIICRAPPEDLSHVIPLPFLAAWHKIPAGG